MGVEIVVAEEVAVEVAQVIGLAQIAIITIFHGETTATDVMKLNQVVAALKMEEEETTDVVAVDEVVAEEAMVVAEIVMMIVMGVVKWTEIANMGALDHINFTY